MQGCLLEQRVVHHSRQELGTAALPPAAGLPQAEPWRQPAAAAAIPALRGRRDALQHCRRLGRALLRGQERLRHSEEGGELLLYLGLCPLYPLLELQLQRGVRAGQWRPPLGRGQVARGRLRWGLCRLNVSGAGGPGQLGLLLLAALRGCGRGRPAGLRRRQRLRCERCWLSV